MELEYLGFSGIPFINDGVYYIEAADTADQVLIASGTSYDDLETNFKIAVERLVGDAQ